MCSNTSGNHRKNLLGGTSIPGPLVVVEVRLNRTGGPCPHHYSPHNATAALQATVSAKARGQLHLNPFNTGK